VDNSNTNLSIPILRYYVLENRGSQFATNPTKIVLFSPGDNGQLHTDTVFSWKGVNNAMAYQIELFNKGENSPLTGKLVPAKQLKLSLSSLSFDWLKTGHKYDWRVRALGEGGVLLGESKLQSLYFP